MIVNSSIVNMEHNPHSLDNLFILDFLGMSSMPFLAHLSSVTFKYNDFTMAAISNCNLGSLEGAH